VNAQSYREDLLKALVAHGAESYKEVVRVASLLEDKAQKTAALAGVFLAAGFGFIKQENLRVDSPLGGSSTLCLLAVALLLLVATVLVCLWVLWIRRQAAPIPMSEFREYVLELTSLQDAETTEDRQNRSRMDLASQWTAILDQQTATNLKKALRVRAAQCLLTLAILAIATSLLLVLLKTLGQRVFMRC